MSERRRQAFGERERKLGAESPDLLRDPPVSLVHEAWLAPKYASLSVSTVSTSTERSR